MTEQLICDRCGDTEQSEVVLDEKGRFVPTARYIAAAKFAGSPVLCSACRGDEQAARDDWLDNDC
jgi:hypothetical protein